MTPEIIQAIDNLKYYIRGIKLEFKEGGGNLKEPSIVVDIEVEYSGQVIKKGQFVASFDGTASSLIDLGETILPSQE